LAKEPSDVVKRLRAIKAQREIVMWKFPNCIL
jgi:hypothetical protein